MTKDRTPDSPLPNAPAPPAPASAPSATESSPLRTLRWWPALMLLACMPAIRFFPSLFESPGLGLMMAGFLGPAFFSILILGWWCFASRAAVREKVFGLAGFLAIAAATIVLLHFSMKGMPIAIMVVPTGTAAFALGLIILAAKPRWRLPVALALCAIAFGYWDTQQSEGVTGRFEPQLLWRWQPTAEERYLQELAARDSAPVAAPEDAADATLSPREPEWPAFRGENRSGIVAQIALDTDWSAHPPRELWRTRIGPAWSSFSVAGDRLFTQEQRRDSEAVLCLDANSGNIVWEFLYPSRFWEAIAGAGPRATPTLAADAVYALGAEGILLALRATDGTELWRRDLKEDAGRTPPNWGFSASPLVVDSRVIVHAGGAGDKGVIAYAEDSGSILWSVASGDHSYSSAQVATFDGVRGILMITNAGIQFLQIDDGSTIWEHAWPVENYRCLQPLVLGNSVLIATSLGDGTRKITVSRAPDGAWTITEDWTTRDMKPEYNDYVALDNFVYGFDGNIFACIDASTGKRAWKRGRFGNGQVLLLPDANQLLVTSEQGEVILLNADPEKLDEIGRFQAIEGKTWNHPVLVGNRLYVRNAEEAACFEVRLRQDAQDEDEATEAAAINARMTAR